MNPSIRKLGTIDQGVVETTPFVFHGELKLFETVQTYTPWNHTGQRFLRCIDVESKRVYPPFAWHHSFASAYVEDDTVWITTTCEEVAGMAPGCSKCMRVLRSNDLCGWENVGEYRLENEGRLFNTSVCKVGDRYIVAYETDDPAYTPKFTVKYAESKDMAHWTKIPDALFGKDFYVGGPTCRYHDGWFYMVFVQNRGADPHLFDWFWQTSIARSRDLINWDFSPHNPMLVASPEDRIVLNPDLRLCGRETNVNNSDLDFCEYDGKLVLFYAWGDQLGVDLLARAEFAGSEKEFLEGYFE